MTDKPADDHRTVEHMADDEPHAPEAKVHHEPVEAHTDDPAVIAEVSDEHGTGGHADEHATAEHGHGEPRLGPVDWTAWGYALVGLVAGLVVIVAFWLAID